MIRRLAMLVGRAPPDRLPDGVEILDQLGRAILIGDPSPLIQRTGNVILAGFAFYRAGPGQCQRLSDSDAEQIIASQGRWAVREMWGNYLLFWKDESGEVFMLRSPMTGPALFHTVTQGARRDCACAFTDLPLARALGFALDRLDPAQVDRQLRFTALRDRACEIVGMSELLAGDVARLEARASTAAAWLPWDHVRRPPRHAKAEDLRNIVSRTISAWSMRLERVQLELSGGIDSSIVASCLAGRRRPWRGFTLATEDPDGDERPYARAMAERAGVELGEAMRPPVGNPFEPLQHLRARPGGFGLLAPSDRAYLAAARAYGADAIFTGTGGDNVFGYMTSTAPILDALRHRGPIAAYHAAEDLARLASDNIWKAIGFALRRAIMPPPLWVVDRSLLSSRFGDPSPAHPWFERARRSPVGSQVYAAKLLLAQPFLDGYDRSRAMPMIAPLLSQPIVEFALAVPSWQWSEGGKNRAFAREAFRAGLPAEIAERTSKGRILSAYIPAFDTHRLKLRPYILDGWLAGAGLLDLDALDRLLRADAKVDSILKSRVLQLADMERWARAITGGVDSRT